MGFGGTALGLAQPKPRLEAGDMTRSLTSCPRKGNLARRAFTVLTPLFICAFRRLNGLHDLDTFLENNDFPCRFLGHATYSLLLKLQFFREENVKCPISAELAVGVFFYMVRSNAARAALEW